MTEHPPPPRLTFHRPLRPRRLACALVIAALALTSTLACGGASSPTSPSPPATSPPAARPFSESSFRTAARITADAQIDVLHAVRPGLAEGDIKRVVDAVFGREGAVPAFAHIVASGPNALVLHYDGDSRQLADGDAMVVDIGAAFDEHCSDITRTYPVSPRFTARQREVYQLVVDVQQAIALGTRTGVDTMSTIQARTRALFAASPLRARDAAGVERTMERFFVHGVSHFVGRLVHGEDTGWSATDAFRAGQVLTVEPGIYIETEGLGIRIEDTYLVTAAGLECLTCACPKEIREVERGP